MFSSRTDFGATENALSKAVRRAKQAGTVLDLTVSSPLDTDLAPDAAPVLSALSSDRAMRYTPRPLGSEAARQAVAEYYARRGVSVDPERVVIVASTSEAYSFLFRLLADPQDNIVAPKPSYPLFDFLARTNDVELRPYQLAYDGAWHLDRASLTEAVTDRSRALLVVSPNNPTGTLLSAEDRAVVKNTAGRHELAVISDEVFSDYSLAEGSRQFWLDDAAQLSFTLNGLSKVAGLPQLKLGWFVAAGPDALVREALSRVEVLADTVLSVSTPVQEGLSSLLIAAEPWQGQVRERLKNNIALVDRVLAGTPCKRRPAAGGWVAMIDLPATLSDEDWAIRLAETDALLVHPGYLFDMPAAGPPAVVVSLIVSPERLEEGLSRMLEGVARETQ